MKVCVNKTDLIWFRWQKLWSAKHCYYMNADVCPTFNWTVPSINLWSVNENLMSALQTEKQWNSLQTWTIQENIDNFCPVNCLPVHSSIPHSDNKMQRCWRRVWVSVSDTVVTQVVENSRQRGQQEDLQEYQTHQAVSPGHASEPVQEEDSSSGSSSTAPEGTRRAIMPCPGSSWNAVMIPRPFWIQGHAVVFLYPSLFSCFVWPPNCEKPP